MLILRIRRAQTALADGRLDEAFALAQAPDVQAHLKGQKLIGRLTRALVERGRGHLVADRLAQAGTDCEKAGLLAGNLPEVAQLRTDLADAIRVKQRTERHRGDVLAIARDHVDNGRLSIGEQILAGPDASGTRIGSLRDQVVARRAQADTAIERARQAIDREDWAEAACAIVEARRVHASDVRRSGLTSELARAITQRAGSAIDQGRLDLADSLLEPARPACGDAIDVNELSRLLDQCREALSNIESGRPRQAMEVLRRLTAVRPSAPWLAQAAAAAQCAAESLENLRSGPLGLLHAKIPGRLNEDTLPVVRRNVDAAAPMVPPVPAGQLPSRLVFHIDGVGSYLVLRDRHISIGPAGSSRNPELALLAEPGMPAAAIERNDEDYFLSCDSDLRINDATARRKLLTHGDKIALSARTRIRFCVPNAASTSAVLQLAGTRMPGSDARQVILLDREMILGPGTSAHIRADVLASPAVLHVRDGRLFCRTSEEVLVNDRPMDRNIGIPLGARVQVGAVSFVVRAA